MPHSFHFALLASAIFQTTTAIYTLSREYSGDTFFQGWDFFTASDPTNGHVLYQSQIQATSQGLIKTQGSTASNGSKQVYIGVDSANQAPNGRSSVRISTQDTFQHGLVLADIAHQPGGICGVWPAFWMVGSNWPQNGEIDIVEGVSTQTTNQMTLHTNAGPVLNQEADFSGKLITPNCNVNAPNQPKNAGCGITDDSDVTFGTDFNSIGGGVYATEWTSQFIKIWFFPRNKIPADIQAGNPTPSQLWGTPNSLFEGNFDMDDHFRNLAIVLNTGFCGDWAGAVWSDTPECAALAPTCNEYVATNSAAFQQAFWLVNTIQVFQNDTKAVSPSLPSTVSVPTSAPTSVPGIVASVTSATASVTSATASKSTSTVTVTKTFTIYPSITSVPQPLNNVTYPVTQVPIPNSGGIKSMTPPETFGLPDVASKAHKRRHGGAVLPLMMAKVEPLA